MPKETELKDYIKDITAEKLNEKISNLKELKKENFKDGVITKIKGYIPFFKYNDKLALIDDLKSIGVKDVFDGKKADLSKLTSDKGAHIADMRHVATIELSNDGIKAAAVTAGGGLGDGGYPFEYEWDVEVEEIDMTFDKPFMYLIRDKKTGEVWFTGAVYKAGNN
jgi:serpin B